MGATLHREVQLLETYDLNNWGLKNEHWSFYKIRIAAKTINREWGWDMQVTEKIELLFAALDELTVYKQLNAETLYALDNIELYTKRLDEHCLYDARNDIDMTVQQVHKNNDSNIAKLNNVEVLLHELLKHEHNTERDYEQAIAENGFKDFLKNQLKHWNCKVEINTIAYNM